jgi:predicted nuclease of predicted toxin-antitoxin system
MRLLANENVFRTTVSRLRLLGHDVEAVSEILPGAADEVVLQRAAAEGRIVLTFDKDYGELNYRHVAPLPKGVILLRFDPVSTEEVVGFIEMLDSSPDVELEGWFSIVRRDGLRQRRLPT